MSAKQRFIEFFVELNAKEQEEVLEVAQTLYPFVKNGLRIIRENDPLCELYENSKTEINEDFPEMIKF